MRKRVEAGALCTDALLSYNGLANKSPHKVINHTDISAQTNGSENFSSLLKRDISGTYLNVEPLHLLRCLDEQSFRLNNRQVSDAATFNTALMTAVGKRLTYSELTRRRQAWACWKTKGYVRRCNPFDNGVG